MVNLVGADITNGVRSNEILLIRKILLILSKKTTMSSPHSVFRTPSPSASLREIRSNKILLIRKILLILSKLQNCFTCPALASMKASTLWISAKPWELTGLRPSLASMEESASL